ncbi:MAG TPA: hypothetical protein PK395_20885 [bacterium]|nr:hypothetical protein [bacterium]HQQ00858.1 hypothetical protein [bacterium]
MTLFCFILVLQIAPPDVQSATASLAVPGPHRNPFQSYRPKQESASPVAEASQSLNISEPIPPMGTGIRTPWQPTQVRTSMERILPPVLEDLRAIVIVHGIRELAMFADRIVSVSDTVEGFTVMSITLDEVTLSDGTDVVKQTLGHSEIKSATENR